MSNGVYVKLAERMNQCEFKMPPVDAFYEMLQMLYTEEEAATATQFPIGLFDLDELKDLYRKDQDELEPLLERMADKGHIFVIDTKEGVRKYELSPWYPGVLEMSILRLMKDPDQTALRRYMKLDEQIRKEGAQYTQKMLADGMDMETLKSTLPKPQMRTLVLNENIAADKTVHTYEDVMKLVENEESFGAQPCCCREMADLRNEPCLQKDNIPRHSCLSFGVTADYVIERGHGIRLTKEECKATIEKLAQAGAVFNANNFVEGMQFICCCCKCCCGTLMMAKATGNINNVEVSNFVSVVNAETCVGCGECVDHCPMEAISLADDTASVNDAACIGCAGCVPICPTESLSMERRSDNKSVLGDRILGFGASYFQTESLRRNTP